MSLETNFVPYQIALDMKSIGFDEECLAGYIYLQGSGTFELAFYKDRNVNFNTTSNIYVSTPTFSQAFKFFRDKHNLFSYIVRETGINHGKIKYIGVYYKITEKGYTPKNTCVSQDTYEEAELGCLIKLIQLVNK
jgi:hypothetical protein